MSVTPLDFPEFVDTTDSEQRWQIYNAITSGSAGTSQVNIQDTNGNEINSNSNFGNLYVSIRDDSGYTVETDGVGNLNTHDTVSPSGIAWQNNTERQAGITSFAGGYYTLTSSAGTNSTNIFNASAVGTPAELYSFQITNTAVTARYFYLFDSISQVYGTQILKFAIPAGQSIVFTPTVPMFFNSGLSFAFSTSATSLASVTAGDLNLNILWSYNNNM